METEILITVGIILVLLVFSAFFSGAETSLTAASIPRMHTLARQGDHRAELETATQQKEKEERDLEVRLRQLRLDLVRAKADIQKVSLDTSVPRDLLPRIELQQNLLKEDLARKNAAFLEEKIEFQQELVESRYRP